MTDYEYGIESKYYPLSEGHDLHRGPMTREQAIGWLAETLEDGFSPGVFEIVRRPKEDWRLAPYTADELKDALE